MAIQYIPSEDLMKAKQVAEFLNRPLLLSGEPGTGKTKFAEFVADRENKKRYVFNTKSTSVSRDLFYTYDAIGHFAAKDRNVIEFLKLEALGMAIVNAYGPERVKNIILNGDLGNNQARNLKQHENREQLVDNFLNDCTGENSVVLIDEVDKAPRDFPNDILNEIENMEMNIIELNLKINLADEGKALKDKIFTILTSNFEKNLPEAFLRRCIYHHIEFLDDVNKLKEIVNVHVVNTNQELLGQRIDEFLKIRRHSAVQKKPATSELIDCIKWIVHQDNLSQAIVTNKSALATLLKKSEDLKVISAGS